MARVLVLREPGDAARTAERLRALGHEPILLPLQRVHPLDPPLGREPVGGFLATSAHAAPWIARHAGPAGPSVLAVGERTAQALRAAGVGRAVAGPGRAAGLAALAAGLNLEAPLVYAAGRVRLPDLEAGLAQAGVPFRTVEVYRTEDRVPDDAELDRLAAGAPPDAVLLLSRRQAELFEALAGRRPDLLSPTLRHLCLSDAVAARLAPGRSREWSPEPRLDSLLSRLD